jgi:hypothetical protein
MPMSWCRINLHLLIHVWEEYGALSACGPSSSSWMFAVERIQGFVITLEFLSCSSVGH